MQKYIYNASIIIVSCTTFTLASCAGIKTATPETEITVVKESSEVPIFPEKREDRIAYKNKIAEDPEKMGFTKHVLSDEYQPPKELKEGNIVRLKGTAYYDYLVHQGYDVYIKDVNGKELMYMVNKNHTK